MDPSHCEICLNILEISPLKKEYPLFTAPNIHLETFETSILTSCQKESVTHKPVDSKFCYFLVSSITFTHRKLVVLINIHIRHTVFTHWMQKINKIVINCLLGSSNSDQRIIHYNQWLSQEGRSIPVLKNKVKDAPWWYEKVLVFLYAEVLWKVMLYV